MKWIVLLFILASVPGRAQSLCDLALPRPAPEGARIAVGFVGFMDRWDDKNRSVRQLTLRLREQGWTAESFSHWRLRTAKLAMIQSLDRNGNKRIDADEAASARVVIYGHSMGGAATVKLAKFLRSKQVPVLLTVQVDSVGSHDTVIPDNVQAAANFYQHQILTVRGEKGIRAANPTRTRILGNFEYEYPLWRTVLTPESWHRQVFGGGHLRMEADPALWLRIESLIQEAGTKH